MTHVFTLTCVLATDRGLEAARASCLSIIMKDEFRANQGTVLVQRGSPRAL